MAKRYTITASDGVVESMNEDMFDFNVGAYLARLTSKNRSYVSRFAVARAMYARPTIHTFRNVGNALARLHAKDPKHFQHIAETETSCDVYRFVRTR